MGYANIRPQPSSFIGGYVDDLLTYRHLAWNLVAADLRSRFRRSFLGILWAVLQPLGFSLIVGVVWGQLFHYPSVWDYALYVFGGMIIWEYFGTVMNVSQDALINAEGYLKQTRIPFLIFQIRTAITGMVVLGAASIGFVALMVVMGRLPPLNFSLLLIPIFYVIIFVFMVPLAIVMSILGTKFRDLRYVTMLAVQALFFISPVMLGREIFDNEQMALLNVINPMVPLLHMFRDCMMNGVGWSFEQLGIVLAWAAFFWAMALLLAHQAGRRLVFSL